MPRITCSLQLGEGAESFEGCRLSRMDMCALVHARMFQFFRPCGHVIAQCRNRRNLSWCPELPALTHAAVERLEPQHRAIHSEAEKQRKLSGKKGYRSPE